MKTKNLLVMGILGLSFSSFADVGPVKEFSIPFGKFLDTDGSVVINTEITGQGVKTVDKKFYGADTNGFNVLPDAAQVTPLQLGYVKFGGNLHSTFNWELNAYYDKGIFYVYSPLERRLRLVQQGYQARPMFQINMLGWQPETKANGELIFANTATAKHAGDAITFINGKQKIGLEDIIMGNEPFDSMDVHHIPVPSADQYIDSYINYAMAVRSAQEKLTGNSNDIKLWGPEIANGWSGWQTTHKDDCVEDSTLPEKYRCSYGNGQFTEFMPYFLSRLAQFEKDSVKNPRHYKMLDYLSFHYYPLFRKDFRDNGSIITNPDGTQNVKGMLEAVNVWDQEDYVNNFDYASPRGTSPQLIKKFQDWRAKYYPTAKIACTEFAIDSVDNIAYHPIVRPLYFADLVGRVAAGGLDTLVNSFLQGGNSASSWAMINGREKSALYHMFSLYSTGFLGKVLKSSDSFGDLVNAYSVKTQNGTNVFLVNKDQVDHSTTLEFQKGQAPSQDITSVTLPHWSVTVLTVPDNHAEVIKVRQYGATEMGIE